MNKNVLRQSVNILAVVATIAINGLANALPLNDLTTGEISDRFQVYFACGLCLFDLGTDLSWADNLCRFPGTACSEG